MALCSVARLSKTVWVENTTVLVESRLNVESSLVIRCEIGFDIKTTSIYYFCADFVDGVYYNCKRTKVKQNNSGNKASLIMH